MKEKEKMDLKMEEKRNHILDCAYQLFLDNKIEPVSMGEIAKKGAFESSFRVMTLGGSLALLCTLLSVPINVFFYDTVVGNVWGDQIELMCVNNQIPTGLAYFIAQFYVEFLDKLLCVYGIYLIIQFVRKIKKPNRKKKGIASALVVVLLLSMASSQVTYAADDSEEDYDTYTSTTYGSAEGLLVGEANDIEQTKEGLLWVGTYAGLYSYDG